MDEKGKVVGFPGAEPMDAAQLLLLDVDVVIPAAIEGVLTKENAPDVKAKIIVEGANGPTDSAADKILNEKGVMIVPDIFSELRWRNRVLLRMGTRTR